jgi:hypothetical protein
MSDGTSFPYSCEIELTFPTAHHAAGTMHVLQVDQEIGDRVTKSFQVLGSILQVYVLFF